MKYNGKITDPKDLVTKEYTDTVSKIYAGIENVSIASFDDGADNIPVKSLIVNINPVQDLHGMDYPWPSGGGQNLNVPGAYTDFDGYYFNATTGKIVAVSDYHRCILIPCKISTKYIIRSGAATTLRAALYNETPTASITVPSTSIVTGKSETSDPTQISITTTDSSQYILLQLFADVDKTGEWAQYTEQQFYDLATTGLYFSWDSNICPISGWTGANINVIGKNFFDYANSNPKNGYQIKADGTEATATSLGYTQEFTPVLPATAYVLSGSFRFGSTSSGVYYYDKDKNFIERNTASGVGAFTFTTPANCRYVRVQYVLNNVDLSTVQLEMGETATAYSPYIGTVYPVSWQTEAGTVYGGTLTDNGDGTWTLTVTQISTSVIWGDGEISYVGTNYTRKKFENAFTAAVSNNSSLNRESCINNIGSYYIASSDTDESLKYYIASNGTRLQCMMPNDTLSDFVFQVTGILNMPMSYILTGESAKTLLGDNNIFADCGDINTLEYYKYTHMPPTDKTRASLNSPAFTGTPTAPTPSTDTNNTQIATTAFVQAAIAAAIANAIGGSY